MLMQPWYHGLALEIVFHCVQWNWEMDPVFFHNYFKLSVSMSHFQAADFSADKLLT